MDSLPLVHGLLREELAAACADLGVPAYRAAQVWQWLYTHRVREWKGMKNIPAALQTALSQRFSIVPGTPEAVDGAPGETRKILVALADGEHVEEVLIPARDRRTVCVSTQVGCRFHCAFCASGQSGFRRNLAAGEIVGQVLLAGDEWGERPTNVVFMGIGEPLDNYDEVLRAVRIINDDQGIGIGARRITISTSGVVPGIRRLAGEGLQVELSVSLHAPDNELRSRLMPVNKAHPLASLMAACREYTAATKRIITFEYTLIRGINDGPACARALAKLLARLHCKVNLIPLSPVDEFEGAAPPPEDMHRFQRTLEDAGIAVTLRASKGGRVKAACGQLRARQLAQSGKA